MRLLLLILLLTTLSTGLQAQKINPKYYLFGILEDYSGGRFSYLSLSTKKFPILCRENNLEYRMRIEELTSRKFKPMRDTKRCPDCHEVLKLSVPPGWSLGAFYRFKPQFVSGAQPFWRWIGRPKFNKILKATKDEKLSYLAGVFMHLEKLDSDTLTLVFGNGPNKRRWVSSLLSEFGCTILSETVDENCIPVSYRLKFIMTPEIRQLAENEIKKKARFANKS